MKDMWVTKSKLLHFRQCPYAFSMLHLGLATPASPAVERPVTFPDNTPRLFKRQGWRWTTDKAAFRNPELRIAGRPQGIDLANGGMVPIVVVGWGWLQIPDDDDLRQINTMDRWSLAFYWLLLQPRRTRTDLEPTGWAVRDREIKPIRLTDTLKDVRFAIEQARRAKTVLSSWSCTRCEICQAHAEHAAMVARDQHSLRLVAGISFRDSLRFAQHGVRTFEDLLNVDDGRNLGVAAQRLAALKLSCAAVMNNQTMVRKPLEVALDPDNLIVLDTEHGGAFGSEGLWLISVRICRHGKISDHLLWIEPGADERPQIRQMMALLRTCDLPVVTWSGTSADLSQLANGAERWKMVGWRTLDNWLPELERRHVDLCRLVREYLALPIPRLGLKEVAAYFGVGQNPVAVRVPSVTGDAQQEEIQITNGRAAVRVREHYAMAAKKCKTYLKTALCEYGQQDLHLTHEVVRRVLEILKRTPSVPRA